MAAEPDIDGATVFGGTGFLGGAIVERLLAEGIATRVAARRTGDIETHGRAGLGGIVTPVSADVRNEAAVAAALNGSDVVVNAVGLYVEAGDESFEAVHVLGAENVARQCADRKVPRLVHISGIGVDPHSKSAYVRARAEGEQRVKDAFPEATILRPSVLFDADDSFLNALAGFIRVSPILPLFGTGRTRLQPVYRRDVAEAVLGAARRPDAVGKIYELGGPGIYRYREIVELLLRRMARRRLLVPVPFVLWDLLAMLASALPNPPLTPAQVTLMRHDNAVGPTEMTFADLAIAPTAIEGILPEYRF